MHRARWMKNAAIKCLRGNITSEQEITKRKNKQKQKETLRSVEIKKIKHYFENFFLPLKKKNEKKAVNGCGKLSVGSRGSSVAI